MKELKQRARLASSVVVFLLLISTAHAEFVGASIRYEITTTTNIEVGVDTAFLVQAPTKLTEEGTALYTRNEYYDTAHKIFLYEYYLKSTGSLVIEDKQGHAMSVTVISPEEERKAQMYANRLDACLMENQQCVPKLGVAMEALTTCESNLSYFKGYVDENLSMSPVVKYIVGEGEFKGAMEEWKKTESFFGLLREYTGYSILIFVGGIASLAVVLILVTKFVLAPPTMRK